MVPNHNGNVDNNAVKTSSNPAENPQMPMELDPSSSIMDMHLDEPPPTTKARAGKLNTASFVTSSSSATNTATATTTISNDTTSTHVSTTTTTRQATTTTSTMKMNPKNYFKMPSWREISTKEPDFNIGVLLDDTNVIDPHVSAMSKPASRCFLSSLVVLNPVTATTKALETDDILNEQDKKQQQQQNDIVQEWLKRNKVDIDINDIAIGEGKDGYEEMLKQSDIDAVYIVLSPSYQKDYVLQALNAKKHVLVNDPVSTLLPEYMETLNCAKKNGKFLQSSTMFVHQYRVQRFMNRVLQDDHFGRITEVDASIQLNCVDVEKVGVKLPLRRQDGSIRVLGRFCVLVSTLFFNRVGSFAESARVKSYKLGKNGEIISAECNVKFTKDRQLNFYVAYIHSATRQSIELKATSRYATMNDFVIEHPDGLATYRVYDRISSSDGKFHVTSGDSIDVAMGMGQERVLWRNFVRLSQELDEQGGWDDNEATAECRELTNVSLQTKKILIALMESFERNGEEIPIEGFVDSE